jgi:hypothetical protein
MKRKNYKMAQPNDFYTTEDPGPCRTCGQTFQWHKENNPVHPFNDGQAGATAFLGKRGDRTHQWAGKASQATAEGPSQVVWPTDPVLRIALMNAGVITADHLRAAEEQLRAAMGEVLTRGGQDGERKVQVGTPAEMDVRGSSFRSPQVGTQPGHEQI